ncbi:MAG: Mfa1 family fimbria major subunit [Rikenellaceae bacterium]
MKKFKLLAICLCTIALGSCVKDADVISSYSDPNQTTTEGNTSFEFLIQNGETTKSTGTVEDSGVHSQGIAEEYKVNKVDIYLFDAASGILVDVYSLEGITLSSNTSTDLIVRYTSDKFDVAKGTYNIFAVANSNNVYNVSTQDQFLAYEDATYNGSNSLMSTIPTEGFMMTNRASENLNVSISADEDKVVSIDLERVVVKVDVAQDYDSFNLIDGNGGTYANIKLQNYMLVNLATNYYLFRHEADLTTFTKPTYALAANFGDVSNTNGYVIDPYFFSKDASKIGSFQNADGFFYQPLQDVATNPTWSMMPSSVTSSVNYCLENTLYQDAQLNGYTTGLVFQARVSPTEIITNAYGSTTITYPSTVYYCNNKFYNSIATLEACLGGDIPNIDDSSSTSDLQDNYITRLTLNGSDYICYYNYWIKHYDNDNASVMGVMEFGVVRNNHYQISINSISGLGTGEPYVKKEEPDETNETLTVNINVVPWIVRDQGDIEL